MDSATEICPLTQRALAELLVRRLDQSGEPSMDTRRKAPRWAFPGTVELWVAEPLGEHYFLGTSVNLSTTGIGIRCDEPLSPESEIGLAVHEPEMSFHGRAVVRHCTKTARGHYLAGLQFVFD